MMVDMLKLKTLLLLCLPCQVLRAYTVSDLYSKCMPCRPGDKIIHPTDCTRYYFCSDIAKVWSPITCPASTYFEQRAPDYPCINPAEVSGDRKKCKYERPGQTDNRLVPIESLAECRFTTTTLTNSPTQATEPPATQDPHTGPDLLTTILASLLAVTVVILLAVILGVVLYRKIQAKRRPTNFYRRALPSIKKPTAAPSYADSSNQQSAANAAYLTRSLLNRDDQPGETIPSQPGDDTYAAYSEIPDLPEYVDPSDNPGLHGPPGSHSIISDAANHIYAEASTLPVHTTDPGYQQPQDPGYQHPTLTPDSHPYTHPSAQTSPDSEHYNDPVLVLPNHGRLEVGVQGVTSSRPSSPPYYIDPIGEDDSEKIQPNQYHTLEPPHKTQV